jgi:hypothetical protein
MESAEHLEEALTKVLSGYLPICACCKKIRDADDEWSSVEEYVGERTEATFTHSMCPECGKDFYGDLWPSDRPTETSVPASFADVTVVYI